MANHVPVVLPAHGTFPELIEDTGGGMLHEPESVGSLAETLRRLILDSALADDLGHRGGASIRDRYHAEAMAQRTLDLYRSLCSPAVESPALQPTV
jgi:glycosyltransferase involved in cell wall biosynthesis